MGKLYQCPTYTEARAGEETSAVYDESCSPRGAVRQPAADVLAPVNDRRRRHPSLLRRLRMIVRRSAAIAGMFRRTAVRPTIRPT
jgi:hypothetical protein